MSATYGPIIFPGTGQVISVTVAQQTTSLVVENQSLYDVLLSVSVSQPQIITQAQANAQIAAGQSVVAGGWDLHVGPRQSGVLEIPNEELTQSPRGGYWTGTIWLEQLIISNTLVTGGSFISNPGNNIWLTGYGPGENPPNPGANNLGYFLASQERSVSVPVSVKVQAIATVTPSATSTWTNIGAGVTMGNFPFSNQAIAAGITPAGTFWVELYSLLVTMLPLSAVAGTAESQQYQVQFILQDALSATVGASPLATSSYLAHLALQTLAKDTENYAYPIALQLNCVVGGGPPYQLIPQLQVFNVSGGGGTNIKPLVVTAWYDVAGAVAGGPGNGIIGISPGAVYSNFVY